jgi:hypothetical protein
MGHDIVLSGLPVIAHLHNDVFVLIASKLIASTKIRHGGSPLYCPVQAPRGASRWGLPHGGQKKPLADVGNNELGQSARQSLVSNDAL